MRSCPCLAVGHLVPDERCGPGMGKCWLYRTSSGDVVFMKHLTQCQHHACSAAFRNGSGQQTAGFLSLVQVPSEGTPSA